MANFITTTDFFDEIANRVSIDVGKCSPQLYIVNNHKSKLPPSANSSSVLLMFNGRFFLLTAGHTVHNTNLDHIGIMISNDFCTIGGSLKYFEPNDENNYEPNNLDIAIFELDYVTVKAIKEKYDFLDGSKIELNHSSLEFSRYLIFGYAAEETKKHFPNKTILPSPFILRTIGVSKDYYAQENIDSDKTLILFANQRQIIRSKTNSVRELSELGGISGSGIWHVFNLYDEAPQFRLVSILTGESENKSVLYSSRIAKVVSLIKTNFDF